MVLERGAAEAWLERTGLLATIEEKARSFRAGDGTSAEKLLDEVVNVYVDLWQAEAGLKTYAEAVAEAPPALLAETVGSWLTK